MTETGPRQVDPGTVEGLAEAKVTRALSWDGVSYELRNHLDGWFVVTWSERPAAAAYAVYSEAETALRRTVADAILAAAVTCVQWNEGIRAGVTPSMDGTRWAAAWIHAGEAGHSEHDDWDAAHLALAGQLDTMAWSALHTGTNMEDQIARAYLKRAAADTRSAVAVAELGDVMRTWQGHLQDGRRVTEMAQRLGVERPFLYRVFAGREWHRRRPRGTRQPAGRRTPAATA